MPLLVHDQLPPCDVDETHEATIHCPECDECFCAKCDALIHARKKNKTHVREAIEVVEPEPEPVPCDSDAAHVAVMYCEDCEENFCADCDYTFHSRRKTANHARFEGARRPEDIAALAAEAEAEAAAAAAELAAKARLEELEAEAPQRTAKSATSSYATAAGKGVNAAASAPAAAKAKATPQAAAPAAAAPAASSGSSAQKKASPAVVARAEAEDEDEAEDDSSQDDRAAQHRAAWDDRRRALCKTKYNVGHWLGLTTDDRKELACTLCQELLFNPQPSATPKAAVGVEWSVQSYWTTYSIDVSCVVTTTFSSKKKQKNPSITTYKVHVDDHGKLAEFDVDIDGVASSQCVVM